MNESSTFKQLVDLHTIPEFLEIYVREGLKLRPLNESDAARILEILASDNTIREKVTVASRIHTREDVATEVNKNSNDTGIIRYTILEEDTPVGLITFWRDDGFWGTQNLDDYGFGYFLDPDKRGKGIISSSLQKLMDIAIQNLQVRQFIAFCEDSNFKSISVLTKLGFKPTNRTFIEPTNGWIERKYIKCRK